MTGHTVFRLVTIIFFFLALACPGAIAGQSHVVTEYPLPVNSTGASAMTIDGNGDVWLIQDSPPALYRLWRDNGSISQYSIKGFESAGFAGMSVSTDGTVWFADQKGNRVGAYNPGTNQTTTFDFPGPMAPSSIINEGNTLWIGCKEEVGELDLVTGEFYDHFVSKMDSYLYDIQIDRLGNVWFVENRMNKVGTYYRMYDTTPEFEIPTPGAYPTCLDIDSAGRLWFVESGPNRLGMFDTEQFSFREYNVTAVDGKLPVLSAVATTGDSLWLSDISNGRILRFYPDEGRFAAAELGDGSAPTMLEADDNGTLWVYEAGSKKLAEVEILEGFGVPIYAPTSTPTPTSQPTATPAATPTPAPGFELMLATVTLIVATFIKHR